MPPKSAKQNTSPGKNKQEPPANYKCTACSKVIKTSLDAKLHPLIGALVCRKCYHTYGNGDFASTWPDGVDEFGDDNYCRWCCDGGDLFGCMNEEENGERCHYSFCKDCIKKNVPEDEILTLDELDEEEKNKLKWLCYACDKDKMAKLRKEAKDALKDLIKKGERKSVEPVASKKAEDETKTTPNVTNTISKRRDTVENGNKSAQVSQTTSSTPKKREEEPPKTTTIAPNTGPQKRKLEENGTKEATSAPNPPVKDAPKDIFKRGERKSIEQNALKKSEDDSKKSESDTKKSGGETTTTPNPLNITSKKRDTVENGNKGAVSQTTSSTPKKREEEPPKTTTIAPNTGPQKRKLEENGTKETSAPNPPPKRREERTEAGPKGSIPNVDIFPIKRRETAPFASKVAASLLRGERKSVEPAASKKSESETTTTPNPLNITSKKRDTVENGNKSAPVIQITSSTPKKRVEEPPKTTTSASNSGPQKHKLDENGTKEATSAPNPPPKRHEVRIETGPKRSIPNVGTTLVPLLGSNILSERLKTYCKTKDMCVDEIVLKFDHLVEMINAKGSSKKLIDVGIDNLLKPLQEFQEMLIDLKAQL